VKVKLSYNTDGVLGFPTFKPLRDIGNKSIRKIYDAIDWLENNNISYDVAYHTDNIEFTFKSEEDVMAFKLRWL